MSHKRKLVSVDKIDDTHRSRKRIKRESKKLRIVPAKPTKPINNVVPFYQSVELNGVLSHKLDGHDDTIHRMLVIAGTHYKRAKIYVEAIFGLAAMKRQWQIDLLNVPDVSGMCFKEQQPHWSYQTVYQPFQNFSCEPATYDLIVWEYPPCDIMIHANVKSTQNADIHTHSETSGLHRAFEMLTANGVMLIPNSWMLRPNLRSIKNRAWTAKNIYVSLTICDIVSQLFSNVIVFDEKEVWKDGKDSCYTILYN